MAVERIFPDRKRGGKLSFDEKYRRITTYLEQDIFHRLQSLRESGEIVNVTQLMNQALAEELKKYEE